MFFERLGNDANTRWASSGRQMDRAAKLRGESGRRCSSNGNRPGRRQDWAVLLGFYNHSGSRAYWRSGLGVCGRTGEADSVDSREYQAVTEIDARACVPNRGRYDPSHYISH
jgi:hypothetical protein